MPTLPNKEAQEWPSFWNSTKLIRFVKKRETSLVGRFVLSQDTPTQKYRLLGTFLFTSITISTHNFPKKLHFSRELEAAKAMQNYEK